MRYVSHEMRTPLNAAILGLKLMCQDFNRSEDEVGEKYDTLNDINQACMAAVDILNDILCFDKMENGLLKLHPEWVPVLSFLRENMKMFSAQAAERGVYLTLMTDTKDASIDPLTATDLVHMDKFKMDQVLRNLLSNALKFTSRGAVTVTARFTMANLSVSLTLMISSTIRSNIFNIMRLFCPFSMYFALFLTGLCPQWIFFLSFS
jgi:signal transduction histidine kinase